MKKLSILLIIICFTLGFNIIAGGQDMGADKNYGFPGLTASAKIDSRNIVIPVSELSKAMGTDFNYDAGSRSLFSSKDGSSIFLKALDGQYELDERGLILHGYDMDKPYSTYDAKFLVSCYPDVDRGTLAIPISSHESTGKVIALAEASIVVKDGEAFISMQKVGTSSEIIDNNSINGILNNNLILVNWDNTLTGDYVPENLTRVAPSKGKVSANIKVNEEVMSSLNEMLEAADSEGVKNFLITSAYRDFNKQKYLFSNKVNALSKTMERDAAAKEAAKVVAVPGTSEHQTGLAVDICSESTSLVRAFGDTPQGRWLEENSWKYGFVVRYQQDKMDITRIIYEPWHIRYVGRGHAEFMKRNNFALEEYIQYLIENRIISFDAQDGSRYMVYYLEKSDLDGSGVAVDLPDNYEWSVSKADKDGYALTIRF